MPQERVTNTTVYEAIGRFEAQIESLIKKVEHNCDASVDGDKSILTALKVMDESHAKWHESHRVYHSTNEHLWGVWTLFKKKPLIPLCIGIILASNGIASIAQIYEWVKLIKF